jgi:hypothetical protein
MSEWTVITTTEPTDNVRKIFDIAYADPKNKLANNYSIGNLYNQNSIAYSVTMYENEPIAVSTLMNRPLYNGAVRALSRYYVVQINDGDGLFPDKFYIDGMRTHAVEQLDQQVKLATDIHINDVFISREDKTHRRMTRIHKGILTHSKYKDWILEKSRWLVCPNSESPACWQFVIRRGDARLMQSEDDGA